MLWLADIPWRSAFFWREVEKDWMLGRRFGEGTRRKGGRENFSQNVIDEKRIVKKLWNYKKPRNVVTEDKNAKD